MKVLVTGANGLLAANIIFELIKRNIPVRGMVRRTSNTKSLEGLEFEKVYGDITSSQDVDKAVEGCNVIIHAAADTNQHYTSFEDYLPANVYSTEIILETAKKHNVERLIYVSTANTFGYGSYKKPGTEDDLPCYPFTGSNYAISKQASQHIILKHLQKGKPEVVVVNPTFMIGARDAKPSSGRLVLIGYKRKVLPVPPGGKNFVHVSDAAVATCNAIERGRNGECYLLAGENMSYGDFFKLLKVITGQKKLFVKIPSSILSSTGVCGSFVAKTGLKTPVNRVNTKILCVKNFYSPAKAINELGMPQTSVKNAIEDCLSWFIENNYIS